MAPSQHALDDLVDGMPVVSMRTASSAGLSGATARLGIAGVAGEDLAQQTVKM